MSISLFLKQVARVERSGFVHLDTDQMELTAENAMISWDCLEHRRFRIHYGYNEHLATLFLIEKGQREKLMQAQRPITEDPIPTLEKFLSVLTALLVAELNGQENASVSGSVYSSFGTQPFPIRVECI